MKTISSLLALVGLFGIAAGARGEASSAASQGAPRVGVYDSRALSYAHFWSDAARHERETLMKEARTAKTAGQTAKANELGARLTEMQKRSHLQVFSTAPAEEALAALKPKLAAMQQELGVSHFVSKWDADALKDIPSAQQVDVTDRLVRELFTPDERHAKVLESMKAKPPLPLDEARRLTDAGRL